MGSNSQVLCEMDLERLKPSLVHLNSSWIFLLCFSGRLLAPAPAQSATLSLATGLLLIFIKSNNVKWRPLYIKADVRIRPTTSHPALTYPLRIARRAVDLQPDSAG